MKKVMKEIRTRRSVRSYLPTPVTKEEMAAILEAGNLAPTGRNAQNLLFVGIVDEDRIARVKSFLDGGKEYYGAPSIVFLFERKGDNLTAQNAGAAMENMMLQATSMGLSSCWIHCTVARFETPEGKKVLSEVCGLDGDYRLVETLALGHAAETSAGKERDERNTIVL